MTHPFILNFHGIGEATARPYEEGEERYWIARSRFRAILDMFDRSLDAGEIAITFDDGNASDAEIAAPELASRGLNATFFVLAGKLDRAGYLSTQQLLDLAGQGFGIGSHGMDHVAWPTLRKAQLHNEVADSRRKLEQVLGRPITSAALPFGRYNRVVLSAAKRAGYQALYSSDGAPRMSASFPIPRFSVTADTQDERLHNLARSTGLLSRSRQEAKLLLKALR